MSQQYLSTRSSREPYSSFEEVVIRGLAPDGGLYIPTAIPKLPSDFVSKWQNLSFQELAFEILSLYISRDEIPAEDLKDLVKKSYSTFRDSSVTPVQVLDADKSLYLLELFHGPTYAFKDVALQFVGNLFEYFLQRKNATLKPGQVRDRLTVIGATSGDTGSAAIYGLRNKKDLSVFILHPKGRISPVQEAQMTTVLDENVHNLAVEGTFDDCQDVVKDLFNDVEFNKKYHLGAVNSINWARILAQITYYYYSFFWVLKATKNHKTKIRYTVPSGNFGDILAGFYARRMGLPIDKLIISTNENDILDRFLKTGRYEKHGDESKSSDAIPKGAKETLSPAMDILVSSNFERYLWYLVRENLVSTNVAAGEQINTWMSKLKTTGRFEVPKNLLDAARVEFGSERVSDEETKQTIKSVYKNTNYILDPHSAVGVTAAYRRINQDKEPKKEYSYISLSTAHPAKFASAVDASLHNEPGYSFDSILPPQFKEMQSMPRNITFVKAPKPDLVKKVIVDELKNEGAVF